MAKLTRIIDYQFRKMRESIIQQREEMLQRHKQQMEKTETILKRIHDNRADFERSWFKYLKGGK
jgi:vacuolar-type H+-ATPase subunit I/STV1